MQRQDYSEADYPHVASAADRTRETLWKLVECYPCELHAWLKSVDYNQPESLPWQRQLIEAIEHYADVRDITLNE